MKSELEAQPTQRGIVRIDPGRLTDPVPGADPLALTEIRECEVVHRGDKPWLELKGPFGGIDAVIDPICFEHRDTQSVMGSMVRGLIGDHLGVHADGFVDHLCIEEQATEFFELFGSRDQLIVVHRLDWFDDLLSVRQAEY